MKVPARKHTRDTPIRDLAPAPWVDLPLDGLACTVAVGDEVQSGACVARSPAGHPHDRRCFSPYTGRVVAIDAHVRIVGAPAPPRAIEDVGDDVRESARRAGLVGMGGAMFPTWIKLDPQGPPTRHVLVNGCESEPYVTCDSRVLAEHGDAVAAGMRLAMQALGARDGVIARAEDGYPGGHERALIHAVLGFDVPAGQLPRAAGVVVLNVQTTLALHQAVTQRRPLVDRVVTVDGRAVGRPGNFRVPLGTPAGHVLEACGVDWAATAALVLGGPMMGRSVGREAPITAGTVAVLALAAEEIAHTPETPCIRCGTCLDVCPNELAPAFLVVQPELEVLRCHECGLCQYACPAGRPLVDLLRRAKDSLRATPPRPSEGDA